MMSKQNLVLREPLLMEAPRGSVCCYRKLHILLSMLVGLSIVVSLILHGGVRPTITMAANIGSVPFQLGRLPPGPWLQQWPRQAAPHQQHFTQSFGFRGPLGGGPGKLEKVSRPSNSPLGRARVSTQPSISETPVTVTHPSFKVKESGEISEYGLGYTMYEHIKTGAEVLSMRNDDENKVFGIAFRTPVSDSTGVPHVLEHSVLCGSDKYPVKAPFVNLLRSSLQTFLNAMTYPDRTVYPLASQNLQDFYNLANVYLDAVLHPRAVKDPMVLQQEGWHYEIDDASKPLIYKGVVYNEMKGVYSSPDSRMSRAAMQGLFPDTSYAHDSGGSPEHIPALTFSQFKSFHEQHYHPSNARVYFYGDDPEENRLQLLESYFSEFGSAQETVENSRIETQKKWSEPRRVVERFPVAAEQAAKQGAAKHMISVNWLLNEEIVPPTERLALGLLSYLLMGSTSAMLYQALIESTLGESVTGGGVSDYLMQSTFSAGMKGVDAKNVSKVEALIDSTLQKAATEGFEANAVEAALNTMEFRLREANTGAARGLRFYLGALNDWIYERDPIQRFRFEAPLQELKQQLLEPGQKVFERLVKKYLVENQARLTVEGVPDPELAAAEESGEVQKLSDKKQSLSVSAIGDLVGETKQLKDAQFAPDSPENLAKLPVLRLTDLDREAKELDITIGRKHGLQFLTHEVDSNGVAYVDLAFDLGVLPVEDVPLLPLFTRMMFEVGTSNLSQTAFTRQIGARTGGVSVSVLNSLKNGLDGAVGSPDDIIYKLMVRGKATGEKTGDLLQLMHSGLTDANLDNQKRALELLKSSKASYESSLRMQGNSFAVRRISARHSLAGYIDEITGGVTYFETLKKLLVQAEEDWPTLLAQLESLRSLILSNRDSVIINLSADKKTLDMVNGEFDKFILSLPSKDSVGNEPKGVRVVDAMRGTSKMRLESENEGFVVSTLVNHVAKGGTLFAEGEKISGAAQVVQRSLARGYLWDAVRVRGGAYGGSCSLSLLSGTFTCFSYRDPNMVDTILAYDQLADHLDNQTLSTTDIEQLIIGAIGDLDKPMSPDRKGYVSMLRYLSGETHAMRQARRDQMFATSPADFAEFAKKLRITANKWRLSIFGSDVTFEKAQLLDIKLNKLG